MEAATEPASIKVQQKAILWSLSQGASRAAACRENDVDRATFYLWLDEEEGYEEKVEDAEQSSIDRMERLAYECAEKAATDPRYLRALFFVLKCKAGWKQDAPTDDGIDWDRISYQRKREREEEQTTAAQAAVGARRDVPSAAPSSSAPRAASPPNPTDPSKNTDKTVQSVPSPSTPDVGATRRVAHNTPAHHLTPENNGKPVQTVPSSQPAAASRT